MALDVRTGLAAQVAPAGALGAQRARYLPIAEHGLIGDLHTSALVGTDGTIDWYCCPRFDSPSVFAAILDADRGGRFRIAPEGGGWTSKQLYLPDTNILITRFLTPGGVGEVQDFMPPPRSGEAPHCHRMIRRVLAVRGEMRFVVDVDPRFDYARARHEVALTAHGALFRSPELGLSLSTHCPLEITGGRDVRARVELRAGETASFVLDRVEPGELPVPYSDRDIAAEFDATVTFWRRWLSQSRYDGRWREMVHRSALTLKLLTYAPTGAIVAPPPPACRSSSAARATGTTATRGCATPPSPSTRCSGSASPTRPARSWDGWRAASATPATASRARFRSCTASTGARTCPCRSSRIWRVTWAPGRCGSATRRRPSCSSTYTYSRLMSWVAVERAIRIARQRGLPADLPRWIAVRDRIYNQVMERGWHPARRAFVQHYDSDRLDASLLLMPLCKFVAPTDPRWIATLDAITAELVSDSLVYRDNVGASPDGLAGEEATFSLCSFWWVEALARAGRLDQARLAFETMLTDANHVGLYSEEIGPTGEQLGNFPQAFTHLALISAAYTLDRQLG